MKKTKIIFMGTPDFSVPALRALAGRSDFHIQLVVTQPDRPKGRGKKMSFSPVKEAALELGLDLYQPEKLSTDQGIAKLSALAPDYFVVVAYGQILSQKILDIPYKYPINIHASLLPLYRGAAPIQAAVKNMDRETGITTMVMARGMDTGDMLLRVSTPIDPGETADILHDRLASMGSQVILDTIERLNNNNLTPVPQDHEKASYVSLLKKSDGKIDWTCSARQIRAHINAMTPWPGAFTELEGKRLKIFKAVPGDQNNAFQPQAVRPGTIFRCDEKGIHVAAGQGSLVILELMGSSGKRMESQAFLRGNPIEPPAVFTTP